MGRTSLEDRIAELTRQNSTLRRQVTRYSHQIELRDRNDADLRVILSRVDGITRLCQQISSLQLDQVAGLCIERIPSLLGVRLVSLYLYEPDQRMLRLARHNHPYPINPAVFLDDQPAGPMALAVIHRQPLIMSGGTVPFSSQGTVPFSGFLEKGTVPLVSGPEQVGQSPFPQPAAEMGTVPTRPFAHRYQTSHCVIVPLCAEDRVVGVLNLADKEDRQPFDEVTDLLPIRQLSELLGASIRNIELYRAVQQQAQTDGLTGLANRVKFTRELGREINRAERYRSPLTLILADVDGLKQINDQFGHVAGDRALQRVARTINQSIRVSDLAARYGGDEFAILLPSTAIEAARQVAERVIGGLGDGTGKKQTGSQAPGADSADGALCPATVTISAGLGQYDGQSTAEQFLEQVDRALYQAKSAGKNRLVPCG